MIESLISPQLHVIGVLALRLRLPLIPSCYLILNGKKKKENYADVEHIRVLFPPPRSMIHPITAVDRAVRSTQIIPGFRDHAPMHLLDFAGLFNNMVLLPVLKLSGIRPGQEQSPFTAEELGALRPVMTE